ncbi:MAG: MotA/TolQ/ExbB proton channel family protein [Pseudomonadales bacterium]
MIIYLEQQLGPLTYPLLICSLVASVLLLDRLAILAIASITGRLKKDGRHILELHQAETKSTREEIAAIWLQGRQRKLASGIRVLQIIALLAPLLGLLGTVVGLIQVFDDIGQHSGPIQPSLLAEGLGIAMKTTAAGLIIAVPAMLGAHLYQLWVDKLTHAAEQFLNIHSLNSEGICTEALG